MESVELKNKADVNGGQRTAPSQPYDPSYDPLTTPTPRRWSRLRAHLLDWHGRRAAGRRRPLFRAI
ncbi:MAG: valine--tRNA ligase [Marinobacter sp.]|nr:valine--tRNA ligase [Marinobacter sp.]